MKQKVHRINYSSPVPVLLILWKTTIQTTKSQSNKKGDHDLSLVLQEVTSIAPRQYGQSPQLRTQGSKQQG